MFNFHPSLHRLNLFGLLLVFVLAGFTHQNECRQTLGRSQTLYISPYTRQVKRKVLSPKRFQTLSLLPSLVGDYSTFPANPQALSLNGENPLLDGDRYEVTGRRPLTKLERKVESGRNGGGHLDVHLI